MFRTLAQTVYRYPIAVILGWCFITTLTFTLALTGLGGATLFERLSVDPIDTPGSQSEVAQDILAEQQDTSDSFTVLVQGLDVSEAGVAETVMQTVRSMMGVEHVALVLDPFSLQDIGAASSQSLISDSEDAFLVIADITADLDTAEYTQAIEQLGEITAQLQSSLPSAQITVSSYQHVVDAITTQMQDDLVLGELIALPLALVLMIFVFGGFLAAAMPLIGAVASIGTAFGVLYGFSVLVDLDSSVVNVATLLCIGLSIDYGLLVVSRYREELTVRRAELSAAPVGRRGQELSGRQLRQALIVTVTTAGRTVFFSAVTVALAVSSLLVFSPRLLRTFGLAGLAIVLIAMLTAITLVPAILVLTKSKLISATWLSRVPGIKQVLAQTSDVSKPEGVFSSLARGVQHRPLLVTVVVSLGLLGLAVPALDLELRNSTIEMLPADHEQRTYVSTLADDFPATRGAALTAVVQTDPQTAQAWANDVAASSNHIAGQFQVGPLDELYSVVGFYLTQDDMTGAEARAAVTDIRSFTADFEVNVTGQAAIDLDFFIAIADNIGWAVSIILVSTFVLLFIMTGSVILPLKAIVMNVLSLAASLGITVWVFQDGHFTGLLNFTSNGGLETIVVVLFLAFGFGLAMDYEVFLLTRIKEFHDLGEDNSRAVQLGLQRSGRIITSAAAVIIVVFLGFVAGDLLVIKQMGFALAVAVLLDATVVRMLLVPATMSLLGQWNWWSPGPLRKLHARIGSSAK